MNCCSGVYLWMELAMPSFSSLFNEENLKTTTILLLTPVLLTTYKYYGTVSFYTHKLAPSLPLFWSAELDAALFGFLSAFLLLGLVPCFIVKVCFREPLSAYGLQIGDWRLGGKALAVLGPVLVVAACASATMPDFLLEYPLNRSACLSWQYFLFHAFLYLLFYIGWEIYFRGFVQFGLREKFGDWNAILVQTALSCLVHIGKPGGEIYGSILGGIVWGVVVFRTRSLLAAIVSHWLLGVSLDACICFWR